MVELAVAAWLCPGSPAPGVRAQETPMPDKSTAWGVGDFSFKAGLLNNVDFQLVYGNYLDVHKEDSSGKSTTQSGFGDFTTRLKVNLWGDDGGKTAFALLPFVKFPASMDTPGITVRF